MANRQATEKIPKLHCNGFTWFSQNRVKIKPRTNIPQKLTVRIDPHTPANGFGPKNWYTISGASTHQIPFAVPIKIVSIWNQLRKIMVKYPKIAMIAPMVPNKN